MDLLVAYDISDTVGDGAARLRRVHDICCAYGQRVQFSVFECRLSAHGLARLTAELQDAIDPVKDSVLIYRLDGQPSHVGTQLGRSTRHELGEPWIL